MGKRLTILASALCLLAAAGFIGFGIWHSKANAMSFESDGYILQGSSDEVKYTAFNAGTTYEPNLSGEIGFKDSEGNKVSVPKESFVNYNDGSIMALSDGVLLDFEDLSDNFINNYYINEGLVITGSGGKYSAETTAGAMTFGENVWKLSDNHYIVQSPTVSVHFAEDDVREASDYVQVVITDDGVVHLLTPENLWMTISENCYLETAGGVKIYPITQIVDNGVTKMSLAKISVDANDSIKLTADETRRQIVPELNIEAVDGEDGTDGTEGNAGEAGQSGESGQAGTSGQAGGGGEDGSTGGDGAGGAAAQAGASGNDGLGGAKGDGGEGGKNGATGTQGSDALIESSTNSALPTMSLTDWQVSANGLRGAITVKDEAGYLEAIAEKDNIYPGQVVITEVATGEEFRCYEIEGSDSYIDTDGRFTGFYNGDGVTVQFTSKPEIGEDVLKPDTQYKLSVVAYYKTTDESELIYSREFISRTFYTDSTGVNLVYDSATTDTVTVSLKAASSAIESTDKVTVYLLTPEQNKNFNPESAGSNADLYTGKEEITGLQTSH